MAKRRHLLRHFLQPQAARFFDELRILARFVQPQLEDVQAEAKKKLCCDVDDIIRLIQSICNL